MADAPIAGDARIGPGARIAAVAPRSPAERAGLRPGRRVTAVDGSPLRDLVDWYWRGDATFLTLSLAPEAEGGAPVAVTIERAPDEPFGITFDGIVFDGVRGCDNACAFCFVQGLPPGMRGSLYVRDDDYRLSFFEGNFITLTNLGTDDVDRILRTRLSPLYVSLHASDPDVRRRLVRCRHEDEAVDVLDRLLDGGIEVHVQIVLVPGMNDGDVLDETLAFLAEREGVLSVGVVPVGFTRYHRAVRASYSSPEQAASVLDRLDPWRARMLAERSIRWVHAADEFHLFAERPVPSEPEYDGYPQYENGIGLVRAFLDELEGLARTRPDWGSGAGREDRIVLSGTLFAPLLRDALCSRGVDARVVAVANRFFGGNVSVAGLITGVDIVDAVRAEAEDPHTPPVARCAMPASALDRRGMTLDDRTPEALSDECDVRVEAVSPEASSLCTWLFDQEDGGDI